MNYIHREIENEIHSLSKSYTVITITGPRQSGKTTLARYLFPGLPYFSFENPDIRNLAMYDPRNFLGRIINGAVLDEIQHVPEITSYLQQITDEQKGKVNFILTGSNQFQMMNRVSQSLAGRTAIIKLLPFSISELGSKYAMATDDYLYSGFYPAVYSDQINPTIAMRNYYETYLQRDLRQLIMIKDLSIFDRFIRVCAGRAGNLFNASAIANEVGISVPTVKNWLSILETSFIVMMIYPYYENIGKRLVKTPKLYFYDTGLLSYLLGIEEPGHVSRDPLRGAIFENMVVMELVKKRFNRGLDAPFMYYRDSHQNEIDLVFQKGRELILIEIKSSQTFSAHFLKSFTMANKFWGERIVGKYLIYDGDTELTGDTHVLNFRNTDTSVLL